MSSSSISDLTLDHNPSSLLTMAMNSTTTTPTPSTGGDFFKGLGGEDPTRLEEHLRALTEERRKVAAFRRELPFCMHLLNQAIEASKEKLDVMPMLKTRDRKQQAWAIGIDDEVRPHLKNNSGEGPFLEDFIPLKTRLVCEKSNADANNDGSGNRGKEQWGCFWSRQEEGSLLPVEKPWISSGEKFEPVLRGQESNMVRKPYFHSKNSREGGAFSPFSKDMPVSRSEPDETPHRDLLSTFKPCGDEKEAFKRSVNSPGGQQNQRKPRRCWSHDLHCRFVNALQQLGGPHVATPKQIRELMKVEGLTNDEVKSHLQKYRLHTRRLSPPTQVAAAASLVPHPLPQLVVLGGIWAPPPDHYSNPYTTTTTTNTNTTTTTSAHNNQLHLYQPTVVSQGLCTRAMMSSASSHPFVHCNTQTLTLEDHSVASRRGLSQCCSGQSEEEEDINCSGGEESSDEHGSHWKNGSPPKNGSTWLHQSLSHAHNQ